MKFTVVPILMAIVMAIASMPTDIYKFCAWNVGTAKTEPWRAKAAPAAAAVRVVTVTVARVRAWFRASGGLTGLPVQVVGLALVAVVANHVGHLHGHDVVMLGLTGLKACRQRDAELKAEIAKLTKEKAAIGDKVVAEKRKMTDAERESFLAFAPKIADLEAQLAENAELLAAAEEANDAERRVANARPDPDVDAATRAAANAGVTTGRDRAEDDPKRGFKSHREFLAKVMDHGRFGRMDGRLKPLYRASAGSDEAGEYSDPNGGFLVPSGFSPDVLALQADGDPTAGLTRDLPMSAPSVEINARVDKDHSTSVSGGLRVYRHAESTTLTSSRQNFEKITVTVAELIGLAHATESQVNDSPVSFQALVGDGFRDEFSAKVLNEKIRGTGTGGQFLGMLNSPALVTISKEAGQAADTIVTENIDKMAARCYRYSSPGTVYLANATIRPSLRALVRKVGTGGSVAAYFTTDANGQERLDGRPIFFTEFASALGDVGDLILTNLREYIEALYQGVQQAESIHARWENHERSYKFWLRNAGMPWWRSVLTPKNGDTISPVVVIEAR